MRIMAMSDLHGTPWMPLISYSWAFEGEHDTLKKWFSKIPSDIDVLITHSPPRIPGSDVDRSLQTDSEHFGSSELTEAIIDKRPRFVFADIFIRGFMVVLILKEAAHIMFRV